MYRSILSSLALVLMSATSALAQNSGVPQRPAPSAQPTRPNAPRPPLATSSQVPAAATLIVLIRSSLTALNQANQTSNYTVLHALGSDTLRATSTPQTLAQAFAGFRQRNVNLAPALYLNPQLTRAPAIQGGRLHLVGSFPTNPMRIDFDIWFEPSQGQWKFVQLNASLSPAVRQGQQQVAPQQRPPQLAPQQQRR